MIFAPMVHPQCTRIGTFSIINNILSLLIKKKKIVVFWDLYFLELLCKLRNSYQPFGKEWLF